MPFVYFIQAGDGGPIKIGFSVDPRKRMRHIQTMNAEQLFLLGTIECETDRTEFHIHQRFAHICIRGEWHRPTEELLQFITENPLMDASTDK
jgi:hypothetical protein